MSDLMGGLDLAGRRVVVAGAGGDALGAVSSLLAHGARVDVVGVGACDSIRDLAERGLVRWLDRDCAGDDLDDAWLVATHTGSVEADGRLAAEAERRRILVLRHERGHAGAPASAPAGPADTFGAGGSAPDPGAAGRPGRVVLVGGGPGDPGLLTVRGRQAVLAADVVVVDRLAPLAILAELDPSVEVVDVAKIPRGRYTPQAQINDVLVDRAKAGKNVVRLKGGDPFVFGRGMEELVACEEAGVEVEVIPGVTSAVAGPGLAGVPVTQRGMVQGFAVVSGHAGPGDHRNTVDWAALAQSHLTLVLLMGVEKLPAIARAVLDAGREAQTPVACIMDAGLPSQRHLTSTLGEIVRDGAPAGLSAPAVTVIGDVAAFARGRIHLDLPAELTH